MTKIPGFLVAADAIVPCRACGAAEGEPCRPLRKRGKFVKLAPGAVHIGRRLHRLLLTARASAAERALLEEAAARMLAEHLRERRALAHKG